jgi:ankyrin repeat protein
MTKYFKIVIYIIVSIAVFPAAAGSYEDFFQAVRLDNAAPVEDLLRRGFDPNSTDEAGQPALALAAREGSATEARREEQRRRDRIDARRAEGS